MPLLIAGDVSCWALCVYSSRTVDQKTHSSASWDFVRGKLKS